MAPSHQLLVQSPDEDWISNFGNSTWRDPSPTQLGEVHPPKLELKPFTGLAKDWSVLSYGFKRLIYDNGRSYAKRLYDLRNYLLKYIQNSLDPDLLHSLMFKYTMQELQRKYGSPQMVSMDGTRKLLAFPYSKKTILTSSNISVQPSGMPSLPKSILAVLHN